MRVLLDLVTLGRGGRRLKMYLLRGEKKLVLLKTLLSIPRRVIFIVSSAIVPVFMLLVHQNSTLVDRNPFEA